MDEYRGKLCMQSEEYLVEHLASLTQEAKISSQDSIPDALSKLKKIKKIDGLWSQGMKLCIHPDKLLLLNAQTKEPIQEHKTSDINVCLSILDDGIFENLVIFSTETKGNFIVHLFQSEPGEASLISGLVNHHLSIKSLNSEHDHSSTNASRASIDQITDDAEIVSDTETRTHYNLHQMHKVAQVVQAFQKGLKEQPKETSMEKSNSKYKEAKVVRDVEILNKCIEEVENFVVMLKRINEARKQLAARKGKIKKKKVEDVLILQAQPPPEHKVLDIHQKIKHALNLLGKLQSHISDPSASELTHYLFIPLGIIVKVTGLDKAKSVLDPLLTDTCVDLLMHCLDSREYQFWDSLGPNWVLTKSADRFRSLYLPPYVPVFIDGWIPSEVIPDEKHAAAMKSLASIQRLQKMSEKATNNPTVIKAALKFKESVAKKKCVNHEINEHQIENQCIVIYDYLAHNDKELTIQAGEKLSILDNSRRWWCVRNSYGEEGYVPSTVLQVRSTFPEEKAKAEEIAIANSNECNQFVKIPCTPIVLKNEVFHTDNNNCSSNSLQSNQVGISENLNQVPIPIPIPPVPPPLPPVSQGKKVSTKSKSVSGKASDKSNEFQKELLHRLSIQNQICEANMSSKPNLLKEKVDSVDVFIPLYQSSTADDVTRWLQKLKFSASTVQACNGKSASEMFNLTKKELIEMIGISDGKQLFRELSVQNGAKKHDEDGEINEFQKVIVNRGQKDIIIPVDQSPGPHNDNVSNDNDICKDMQYSSEEIKKFEEQSTLIKKQKEELKRLKSGSSQ